MKSKKEDLPHFSLRSAFFVGNMYRQAIGKRIYFVLLYNLFVAVVPSVMAILLGRAGNQIVAAASGAEFWPLFVTIGVMLAIQLVDTWMAEIYALQQARSWQDVYCYMSAQVANKYFQIPMATREDSNFADKFSRVRDFAGSVTSVSTRLIQIGTGLVGLISAVAAAFVVSPIVTLVVALSAIPYAALSLKYAREQRINYRRFSKERRIAWEIEHQILNSNSALEIEVNELGETLIARMIRARRRSYEEDLVVQKAMFWPNVGSRALEQTTSAVGLSVVALEIMQGALEIGSFLTTRGLLEQMRTNIAGLFGSIASASSDLVNATDYMEFMETPERANGEIVIDHLPVIEFQDVSFYYPKADQPALSHVSFTLKPGDSLAVVGANGAGKTTLVKLLVGAYTPTEGVILVDGQPLERIERTSYLAQIGVLFQEYSRYEFATLGENVWFGDVEQKYDRKRILAALELAGLEDLPKKYKRGLNQILAKDLDVEHPAELSGGQWQRVGIARAFYRQPNILLLDEPTSAVDARSEYEIFKNILKSQEGKTTLIISHRFSTVRKAEQIIVLDHGVVVEQGTHGELMKKKGLYAEMFTLQAEGYN